MIPDVIADHHGDPAPEFVVVNKVYAASDLALAQLRCALSGAVFVSARTEEDIGTLRGQMARRPRSGAFIRQNAGHRISPTKRAHNGFRRVIPG